MKYSVAVILGLSSVGLFLSGCDKNKKAKETALKHFKVECPGVNSKCSASQVTVTNIGKNKYSDLVVVCKDKKHPDAPPSKPYYTFPFSLSPTEVKCVDAVENCLREKIKDMYTGKEIDNYVTLLEIDSAEKPIWEMYTDCPQ